MTESRNPSPHTSAETGALTEDIAADHAHTERSTVSTVGTSPEPMIEPATGPGRQGAGQDGSLGEPGGSVAGIRPAIGRIPILAVGPVVEGGRWAAKAVVGEQVPITATVFREGHDAVAATAVLIDPDGVERTRVRMTSLGPGLDRFGATVIPDRQGRWNFQVEGWGDPYGTWEHDAVIKIAADVDVELMLLEGVLVLERSLAGGGHSDSDAQVLRDAVHALRDGGRPAQRM